DQLANFHQLTSQLHAANEKTELSNQFLKTVAEQNVELEQLQKQLRQAKIDRWTASAKVDEMIRLTKTLQGQLERKEEDVVSAQQREAASDKLLQQMQSSIKQLETRLHVTVQDAEQLRTERAALEKQIRTLQKKCAHLEREKYEAVAKVQDCIQLLEEANLQKSQALFKKKQKEEEIKKMKDEIFQLTEDAAAKIRKAVDSAKKQYNVQISQLTEELVALHMECGEKQGQIERAIREKRAVEEELEKIQSLLSPNHHSFSKMIAGKRKVDLVHDLKEDFSFSFEEEKSNYQKNICNLQNILDSEREKSGSIDEQRSDLSQQKLRNQELIAQLEMANNKVIEEENWDDGRTGF
ncbi:hypothetical protein CIB84_005231, partial [Bambusicola thoracicus]